MKILGISCFYHESAAALLIDGRIVAASAEERFSRQKHDYSFPISAVDFCLKFNGVKVDDLDYVVFYEKPFIKFERILNCSLKYFPKSWSIFVDGMRNSLSEKLWVKSIISQKLKVSPHKILFVPHHLSHISASYYSSGFDRAAFLTLDGVGEWTTGSWGVAKDNKITPKFELRFPHSVGLLYSAFTAFLGFEVNDGEYKVMGMAAYGKPIHKSKIKKLYKQYSNGSIELDLSYFSFQYSSEKMYTKKFAEEFKDLNKFDIAASLQECTEEIILRLLEYIQKQTKEENVVYAGGVALNSVINGMLLTKTKFKRAFIYPAAGDDGGAVGAALYVYFHVLNQNNRSQIDNVFLGPSHTSSDAEKFLKSKRIKYKKLSNSQLIAQVAKKLSEGKVVGWFEGRAEFGPRALGHRSILADPRSKEMKDIVNSKIKFREEFRPFAPVILSNISDQYFNHINYQISPFMLGTFIARKEAQKMAPAVVHDDKTSRIQTVDDSYQGRYKQLLEGFFRVTGVPILLNTSFNLKGEPIVNTPQDAYSTFIRSGIDILVIENIIVEK